MNHNENRKANRLIDESSPYLLQHAYNPVDWYAWGDEAFEKAKKEDKPIFLSIGYSTCHWCHVMERESFEDSVVAELLNKDFIAIKVDREERPDIDQIYMEVCQMMTGSGGWPLTIMMTPDKEPFFAGTYFPKNSMQGRIGMIDLLPQVAEIWENDREKINNTVDEIVKNLKSVNELTSDTEIDININQLAFRNFTNAYIDDFGGFSEKPKFPSPHNLIFLLRYYNRTSDKQALRMATHTLKMMGLGGIYDHIGFGFHRYSTDEKWLVPHFEKMLYDQAMLISALTEAYQITKDSFFKQIIDETITYLLRDMTDEEGGFYSAEDADSEGIEGKFYIWTKDEIKSILNEDAELFNRVYNITEKGNFIEEHHFTLTGKNIPHLNQNLSEYAEENNIEYDKLSKKINSLRQKLFDVRENRIHPFKDDKILTDWNGLMIAALSKAGRVLGNKTYINAAEKAFSFIKTKMSANDTLLHRYRKGNAGIQANLDDYAFVAWGALELYQSTFDIKYLQDASKFTKNMIERFWDEEKGGFYFTSKDAEKLFNRKKDIYDGAIPSGNSVAFDILNKLSKLTADSQFANIANKHINYFKAYIEYSPNQYSHLLSGLEFYFGETSEIVIVGKKDDKETKEILNKLNQKYLPNTVILFKESGNEELSKVAEYTKFHTMINDKVTIYLCKNFACEQPTNNIEKVLNKLK